VFVLDANVVLPACTVERGFRRFGRAKLVAPAFMWAEARSSLHEAVWRGELPQVDGRNALRRLMRSPVRPADHPELATTAWAIADELGFAKTYDAEYLALATLLRCKLVTLDERLRRGSERLGVAIHPSEV
jgi:predicted nucleic acid-binding protein